MSRPCCGDLGLLAPLFNGVFTGPCDYNRLDQRKSRARLARALRYLASRAAEMGPLSLATQYDIRHNRPVVTGDLI